jgi:hypothetical protein
MNLFAIRERVRTAKHDEFVIDGSKLAGKSRRNRCVSPVPAYELRTYVDQTSKTEGFRNIHSGIDLRQSQR